MYDDGTHGDATEADTIFTMQFTVNEPVKSTIYVRVYNIPPKLDHFFGTDSTICYKVTWKKEVENMGSIRKNYSAAFKSKVALNALQEKQTLEELSSKYQVSSRQIQYWKKEAIDNLNLLFEHKRDQQLKEKEDIIQELYKEIGKLKMEYEWLKKKLERFNL
jgi:transposase-like protein